MFLDFSKTSISPAALEGLFELARAAKVEDFIERLFAGEPVNMTEHRSAMHMALRSLPDAGYRAVLPEGGFEDASAVAAHERQRMEAFVRGVHDGSIVAADGHPFTRRAQHRHRRLRSWSAHGLDGADLGAWREDRAAFPLERGRPRLRAVRPANWTPARTLVLVASKTFTTLETMTNGHAAP